MTASEVDGAAEGDPSDMITMSRQREDKRWCRGGTGRYSEYGVVGADQYDESHFDDRSDADDDLEKGQIKFPQDKLYGRDDELSTLLSIYDELQHDAGDVDASVTTKSNGTTVRDNDTTVQNTSSSSQIVFIGGYSGTGKSSLVKQFFKMIHADSNNGKTSRRRRRPWIVSGKFDEFQSPDPYSAIANGINGLCTKLITYEIDSVEEIKSVIDELDNTDYRTLAEIFPGLTFLVNNLKAGGYNSGENQSRTSENGDYTTATDPVSSVTSDSANGGGVGGADITGAVGANNAQQEQPTSSASTSFHSTKESFRNLIKALASNKDRPLVVFIDDLQWSDAGSLDLLSVILHDAKLENVMFIGSYRSNEVSDDSALMSLINETETIRAKDELRRQNNGGSSRSIGDEPLFTSASSVHRMEMSDLSQQQICDFIAETLDLDDDDAQPLVEAIYSKTLGNIFFTMQALEELVRKNALFYDVMFFKWEWNLSKVDLENLLSDDVVEMVQSKIKLMPNLVQEALITASYTRSTFDVDTLRCLLVQTQGVGIYSNNEEDVRSSCCAGLTKVDLVNALDQAVLDGLLFNVVGNDQYTFAHDRIQEAASSLVLGNDRNELCLKIGQVLVKRSMMNNGTRSRESNGNLNEIQTDTDDACCGVGEDWMLFVGVHHLNSISSLRDASNNYDLGFTKLELANLNLTAAKLATVKSAYSQAVRLIRAGVNYLDAETKWTKECYDLCLEMHQILMENEFVIGNHEHAREVAEEILSNATSLQDKCLAQATHLDVLMKCRKYADGIPVALQYLAEHGVRIPSNPGKAYIMKEKLRLRVVKGNRKLEDILSLPNIDGYSDGILKLLLQLTLCAGMVSPPLAMASILIGQKLTWEQGKNRHLPVMLALLTTFLRIQKKPKNAYDLGCTTLTLLDQICAGAPLCKGLNLVAGCIMLLRSPYSDIFDKLNDSYRVGLESGDIEWRLLSAMQYCHTYFCTGWPTGASLEPKIILYEEEARRLCQPPSVTVTFCICRQTLLNLQGRGNPNPTLLQGRAVDEEEALAGFEGSNLKQTARDFAIYRLLLACVFGDDSVQQEMIDRLAPYPDFDFSMPRQHLRDTFVGLAAFALGRKLKDKKYTTIGRQKQKQYQKLAKLGSVVAAPILACFKASKNPTMSNYHKAIDICGREGLLHLQAMMNENCGLYLLERNQSNDDQSEAKRYLTRSMWIYYDWGCMGKVQQMRLRHRFLHGSRRSEKTPNGLLNFMAKAAKNSGTGGGGGDVGHSTMRSGGGQIQGQDEADISRSSYTHSLTVGSGSAVDSGSAVGSKPAYWERPTESYHAHFDCFSGAAGDMMLAACLDSVGDSGDHHHGQVDGNGPSKQMKLLKHITHCIEEGMPELKGEFSIHPKKVWRGGMASIAATHVTVQYDHKAAPVPKSASVAAVPEITDASHSHSHERSHQHSHEHSHGHSHGHSHEHSHGHSHNHSVASGGDDGKDDGDEISASIDHDHSHSHAHSKSNSRGPLRNLPQIRTMLEDAPEEFIPIWVRDMAIKTFTTLADAESRTHGTSNADTVFFHEVGAIDSIVDTVGTLLALYNLGVTTVSCSRIPVGEGTVWTDHGLLPVPAPATLRILKGMPLCQGPPGITGELVTPTGAALLSTLTNNCGKQQFVGIDGRPPAFTIRKIGVGAGTRDYQRHPNILRLWIGDSIEAKKWSSELVYS